MINSDATKAIIHGDRLPNDVPVLVVITVAVGLVAGSIFVTVTKSVIFMLLNQGRTGIIRALIDAYPVA